jgi:hypothetical protein
MWRVLGAIGGRKSAGGLIGDEVRMTARSLMEPLERADHARCWFGILLGPQGQCPNRGVYRKPADAFFAFTHWLNGARWCEVHRHDYDVEVDQ